MSPHVVALHIWSPDLEMPTPVNSINLEFSGIPGDRHFGSTMLSGGREKHAFALGTEISNYRQISIVDRAELSKIAENLEIDGLAAGTIADNICTEGLPDLTALQLMSRLVFPSGASIMTGGANAPCTIAGAMVESVYGTAPHRFPKAAMHLRGITGWVERPGAIYIGDPVTVVTLN